MARPIRHIPRDFSRRRLGAYLAVAVFLLADIALIAYALDSAGSGATARAPRPVSSIAAEVSIVPTKTPTPALESAAVMVVPPTRFLSAVDDVVAWRAVTGECPATPAAPELTTNSGTTWSAKDATSPTEVTAVQSLSATSASIVAMVGLAGSNCSPQFVKTFVAGDTFEAYPDQLADVWFVDPADRATVHSPSGDVEAPCDSVIIVAVRDNASAAALCSEGRVFSTTDSGTTWSSPTTIAGLVNLSATDEGYIAAAFGASDCAGVQLRALSMDLTTNRLGCYPTTALPSALVGNVTLSDGDGTLWLWVGDMLVRSRDGGVNWE